MEVLYILLGALLFYAGAKLGNNSKEVKEPEPRVEYKFVHAKDGKEKKRKIEEQEEEENHFFQ